MLSTGAVVLVGSLKSYAVMAEGAKSSADDEISLDAKIEELRKRERETRIRWIQDELHWRKLPSRAWPEKQPNVEDIPKLKDLHDKICRPNEDSPTTTSSSACQEVRFDLATALLFNQLDQKA